MVSLVPEDHLLRYIERMRECGGFNYQDPKHVPPEVMAPQYGGAGADDSGGSEVEADDPVVVVPPETPVEQL